MLLEVLLLILGKGVSIEHLSQGVLMILEPEPILPLDVEVGVVVRVGLRVIHDLVLIIVHWSGLLANLTGKPVMPAFESIMWSPWIANEIIVVDPFQGFRTKPSSLFIVHVLKRKWRIKHSSICIEDILKVIVHFRNAEEGSSMLSISQINEDRVKRDANYVSVLVFRRCVAN